MASALESSSLSQLKKNYFDNSSIIFEVKSLEQIRKYAESKSAACWTSKQAMEGNWIHLYSFSPVTKGSKSLVGVCKLNNYLKACGSINITAF